MSKRPTLKTIDEVINHGNEREHIVACLQLIYKLLNEATDERTRRRLGTLSFLISHRFHDKYPDLDGVGLDLNEWSMLLTESQEWADQHIKDLMEEHPDVFTMLDEDG